MATLFSPIRIGAVDLTNRMWMSATTCTRAAEDNVPTKVMADYFAQRAGAGLIVTDCSAVSEQARGVIRGPGVWRRPDRRLARVDGPRAPSGRAHLLPDLAPRASGASRHAPRRHAGRAIADLGDRRLLPAVGTRRLSSTRELGIDEIPGITEYFAQATHNAQAAGFDGVELQGANGYLHD